MPLLMLLKCIFMHQRNTFLDHLLMIIIIYRSTRARKISMENADRRDWLVNSLN